MFARTAFIIGIVYLCIAFSFLATPYHRYEATSLNQWGGIIFTDINKNFYIKQQSEMSVVIQSAKYVKNTLLIQKDPRFSIHPEKLEHENMLNLINKYCQQEDCSYAGYRDIIFAGEGATEYQIKREQEQCFFWIAVPSKGLLCIYGASAHCDFRDDHYKNLKFIN